MNLLLQASKDFDGRASCKVADNGNWLIRGMNTSLKGYQMLGSAFMRRRENDIHEPKGGLMADQMGLGKTLMMLGECATFLRRNLLIKHSQYCQLSRDHDQNQRHRPEDYTIGCQPLASHSMD